MSRIKRVMKALDEVLGVKTDTYYHAPSWLEKGQLSEMALDRSIEKDFKSTPQDRLDVLEDKMRALLFHLKLEWVEGGRLEEIK